MPPCRIDSDALRDLASALEGTAARLADAAPAASLAASVGEGAAGAAVAHRLAAGAAWCEAWAPSLRERAHLVERHSAVFATPTLVPADTLQQVVAGRDFAALAGRAIRFTAWQADVTRRDLLGDDLVALLAAGGGVDAVSRFFATLTPDEVGHIATTNPEIIGPLDGAPLDARFAANRMLLAAFRRDLLARLGELEGAPPSMWAGVVRARDMAALRRDIAIVTSLLRDDRRILLFDPSGPMRIAEWIGRAEAGNVAVLVPGAGSNAAGFDTLAAAAATMVRLDDTDDLAVVAALVYEAPQSIAAAAFGGYADRGGPQLASFVAGLPIAGRHVTIIGHSYGAVVAGEALRHGLATLLGPDADLVALAAPGVRTETAADLGLAPGRVWAALVPGDEIQLALHPRLAGCLLEGATPRAVPSSCDPGEWLLHGRNPVHPEFGAQVFDADAGGARRGLAHDDYLKTWGDDGVEVPTAALANVLRIATGRHGEVTSVGSSCL